MEFEAQKQGVDPNGYWDLSPSFDASDIRKETSTLPLGSFHCFLPCFPIPALDTGDSHIQPMSHSRVVWNGFFSTNAERVSKVAIRISGSVDASRTNPFHTPLSLAAVNLAHAYSRSRV